MAPRVGASSEPPPSPEAGAPRSTPGGARRYVATAVALLLTAVVVATTVYLVDRRELSRVRSDLADVRRDLEGLNDRVAGLTDERDRLRERVDALSRLAGDPLDDGDYTVRVRAAVHGRPDRLGVSVLTGPAGGTGWRLLEVAAGADVRLAAVPGLDPTVMNFVRFARMFNGGRPEDDALHTVRFRIALAGGRVTAIKSLDAVAPAALEPGATGPFVEALQERLAALRFDVGPRDGTFGDDTSHAVVAFQTVNGLPRDGTVTRATWEAMARPVIPAARNRSSGETIEVDLTRQVLYLVRDGRIVRIVDASTGGGYAFTTKGVQKVAITVTGEFRIYWKIEGWYQSSLGPMYRSSFYYRGFAIHGYGSVPPYPASHGCVRVTFAAVDRLWPHLFEGMPVSVYRG